MKKPAKTWPTAVPTSVTRVTAPPLPGLSVIVFCADSIQPLSCAVGDVERAVAQPVA